MTKRERNTIEARIEVLFEKSKITEVESYNTEALADIAYSFTEAVKQLTRIADQGEPTRIVFAEKPAPDAGLVDAVRELIGQFPEICIEEARQAWGNTNTRIIQGAMDNLKSALAAHKPEVEKYGDCPYCGTELVKRDTTTLGGDESFVWCPDCERVIEDGERMDV